MQTNYEISEKRKSIWKPRNIQEESEFIWMTIDGSDYVEDDNNLMFIGKGSLSYFPDSDEYKEIDGENVQIISHSCYMDNFLMENTENLVWDVIFAQNNNVYVVGDEDDYKYYKKYLQLLVEPYQKDFEQKQIVNVIHIDEQEFVKSLKIIETDPEKYKSLNIRNIAIHRDSKLFENTNFIKAIQYGIL